MNGLPAQMRVPRSTLAKLLASLCLLVLIGAAAVRCNRGRSGVSDEQASSSVHVIAASGSPLVVQTPAAEFRLF